MATPQFHGVIPPVPTVLDENGGLDRPGMSRLIDHLLASDVNGLFFLGSAGEFSHMAHETRLEVAEFCVDYVAKRKPVLIGIAHSGTQETIRYGKHAEKIGADGVVVVNPFYALLTDENLYRHYRTIADALTAPIILYNFPGLTGQDIKPAIIKRLVEECPNIIGLKDTVDTLNHIRETIHLIKPIRPDFVVFAGFDEYLFGTLILGGDGCIPASANFAPQLTCGIYKAYNDGDFAQVVALQKRLSFIPQMYSLDAPFFNVVKEAIRLSGIDIPTNVLQPANPLSDEKKQIVRDILKKSGLI